MGKSCEIAVFAWGFVHHHSQDLELLSKHLLHLVCSICRKGILKNVNGMAPYFIKNWVKIVTLLYLPGGLFAVLRPTPMEMSLRQ